MISAMFSLINIKVMKKINFLGLVFLASLLLVFSCNKEESVPGNSLSTADKDKGMLTAVSWVMTSRIENGVSVFIPDCEKDDIYTFSKDGTFSHDIGSLTCGTETNSSGTWTLSPDLNFTFSGTPMGFVITSNKLVLSLYNGDIDIITQEMDFVAR
jgi:hypothetical protein